MSRMVSASPLRPFWMRSSNSESVRLRSMVSAWRCCSVCNCRTVNAEYTPTAASVRARPASSRKVGDWLVKCYVPLLMNHILPPAAARQAEMIRQGEVSAVELVRAHLERIAAVNPSINAVVETLDREALRAAAEVDRRRVH